MLNNFEMSRRDLVKTTTQLAGGLIIGFYMPGPFGRVMAQSAKPGSPARPQEPPNAFIQIAPDNSITIVINKLEMGQGVNTSMAQLIAEELGCNWQSIRSVSAPVNPVYNHTAFPTQMTGGSSALISSWDQHRRLGAQMREMLKGAAGKKWNVPTRELTVRDGFVTHEKTKQRASFGDLAEAANQFPLPVEESLRLKTPNEYTIIGKSVPRVDAPDKSSGKAIFGMDVRIPDMVYAVIARPPAVGATIESVDDTAARAISGVKDVIRFGDKVAVLARNTHAAKVGRDVLAIKWNMSGVTKSSNQSLIDDMKKRNPNAGLVVTERGKVAGGMSKAKKRIAAEYEFPYLAHATMEPMNCTIQYDGETAEIWSGHQMPAIDQATASAILGIAPDKIKVNTVYAGGSFGRRGNKNSDYTAEAAALAKVAKRPLKVVWTREDDMAGGFFRPMNFHRVQLGLDASDGIAAWDHDIVGQSVIGGSMFEAMMVKNGIESTIVEGVSDTHYDIANFRCRQIRLLSTIPTLWWRSVGHTHTAYVMETMIDEYATTSKKDPMAVRKKMLAKSPKHMAVLQLLEKQTGWGKKQPPKGRAWGLAIHESFNSVVGQVAEVSLEGNSPKVHRVWCAVHCGQVVNPEGAKTQVEGAIVYGLSAALYEAVKVEDGKIKTQNFDDFPVLRLSEMPVVAVEFVPSHDRPTGLGEPGLPPIAPAVANAIFILTGKRVRKLPFSTGMQNP